METYESLLAAVSADDGEPITNPATDEVIGRERSAALMALIGQLDAEESTTTLWSDIGGTAYA